MAKDQSAEQPPTFGSLKEAQRFVQKTLAAMGAPAPEDAVPRLREVLSPETLGSILDAWLAREARDAAALREQREALHELSPGWARGEYPYRTRYPTRLYEEELYDLQVELLKLQEWVKRNGKRIAVLFEGRDTAGKGGTIRRFVENLNPRGARIVALPKPTEVEERQWYFQRYAAQLPNPGEICFFDRSWYNRGVVEPVMGFCTPEQTDVFLSEVSYFEKCLVRSGIILIKIWLSITREEQLARFRDRQINPLKRWKLSPVDIASIDKWNDYTAAMQTMFRASDSPDAPWTVIWNEDKKRGRLNAIRVLLHSVPYEGRDLDKVGPIDPLIVRKTGLHLPSVQEPLFASFSDPAAGSYPMTARMRSRPLSKREAQRRSRELRKLAEEIKDDIRAHVDRKSAAEKSWGRKAPEVRRTEFR